VHFLRRFEVDRRRLANREKSLKNEAPILPDLRPNREEFDGFFRRIAKSVL